MWRDHDPSVASVALPCHPFHAARRRRLRMPDAFFLPFHQRHLLGALVRRELAARHRASLLGALWFWIAPLLALGVYAFVFGGVLATRLPGQASPGWAGFALVLFSGLALATFFNEVLGRAPGSVLAHPGYVKKVVFPLHLLACVDASAALVTLGASLALVVAAAAATGGLAITSLALPLVVAPLVPMTLGLAWAVAALGAYLRDLSAMVPPALTALVFLAPVMYPRESVPEAARQWMVLNPLTVPVEQLRRVLFLGEWPDLHALGIYAVASLVVYFWGFAVFRRLMKGFADVL